MEFGKNKTRRLKMSKKEFSLFPYELEEVFSIQEVKQNAGWGIHAFELPNAWSKTKGEGIKIAVLDTGCDLDHPDLRNNILPGINLIDKKKDPWDKNKHGTHVCGIIAAENNEIGVVGVAPHSKIIPVKVLDDNGNGNAKSICEGIKWSVDVAKADFICMSLGSPSPIDSVHDAIKYALSKKVICFVAAGNSGKTKKVFYPAEYPESIAIGSIDENFERSNFSNTGDNLDFLAPGSRILSTVPDGWYAIMSGTSMATPFAVGVAALYLSYVRNNNLSVKLDNNLDYVNIFKEHTLSIKNSDLKDKSFYEGFGILDPKKLFDSLRSIFFELFF
jgi:subtilisin family serine protease